MNFFARVTSRILENSNNDNDDITSTTKEKKPKPKTNAIIMGRKTYHSLPKNLRPLRKRISVIISRDSNGYISGSVDQDLGDIIRRDIEKEKEKEVQRKEKNRIENTSSTTTTTTTIPPPPTEPLQQITDAMVCSSLESSLDMLNHIYDSSKPYSTDLDTSENGQLEENEKQKKKTRTTLGNIFIIGGAEIYNHALKLGEKNQDIHEEEGVPQQEQQQDQDLSVKNMIKGYNYNLRIIMTSIKRKDKTDMSTDTVTVPSDTNSEFTCDTFFPLDAHHLTPEYGWREVTGKELSEWVGEDVNSEWRDEGDVFIRIVGYEHL